MSPLPAPETQIESTEPFEGMVLDRRYRLETPIGQGGAGFVWRARHLRLGHAVAVKFLKEPQNPGMRDRFVREAQVAAAVRHRNVVDILDVGEEQGYVFIVMELLDGENLGEWLNRGAFPVAEAVRISAAVLGGLTAVHDAGITHRDLKPENVLIVSDGDGTFPKLVDFGISKVDAVLGSRAELESVVPTQENLIIGTPDYMAPEQVRGKGHVDQRCDVWSMGVMMYELFVGDIPFKGETTADIFIAIATEREKPLTDLRPDLGAELSEFVHRALRKDPSQRFENARAMRKALVQAALARANALEAQGGDRAEEGRALRGAVNASYEPGDSGLFKLPALTQGADGQRAVATTLAFEDELPTTTETTSVRRGVLWAALGLTLVALAIVVFVTNGESPQAPRDSQAAQATTTRPPLVLPVLRLDGLPNGAILRVNGVTTELIDGEITLPAAGAYTLGVEASGFEPWSRELDVVGPTTVTVTLEPSQPEVATGTAPLPTRPVTPRAPSMRPSEMSPRFHSGIVRDPGF